MANDQVGDLDMVGMEDTVLSPPLPPTACVDNPELNSRSMTPAMGLDIVRGPKGDRVIVDEQLAIIARQIEIEHSWVEALLDERRKRDAHQVSRVDKLQNLVWFGVGLATASLTVQVVRIAVLLVLRDTK